MSRAQAAPPRPHWYSIQTLCWWTAIAAVSLTALVFQAGGDTFRLPKEAVVRCAAIVLLALVALELIWRGRSDWLRWSRECLLVAAAIIGWTVVSFAFATNRAVAAASVIDVFASAVLFLGVVVVVRQRSTAVFLALFIPAAVNAIVLLLQSTRLWNPFDFPAEITARLRHTGLIGNPDDAGMYFTIVGVTALAVCVRTSGRMRVIAAIAAVMCAASIVMSESLTALAAFGVAVFALAIPLLRRRTVAVAAAVLVVAVLVVSISPAGTRIRDIARQLKSGRMPVTLSSRVVPALAAASMFGHRPINGVGPGCFAYEFFDVKLRVEQRRPYLRGQVQDNYADAHNDHLQMLAEGGVVGFVIFAGALVALGLRARRSAAGERGAIATLLASPLAIALAALGVSLFPLHIASARTAFLFAAATVTAWTEPDDA